MPRFFVDPDISSAKTIDTSFYTDPAIFEKAKEKIFSSSWQFIGDESLVKEKNSAYPFIALEQYLNEPLLLTHDKDGELHCLSNVCTHRGNIIVDKPCKAANLRCKYHGRLFNNNGKFISMPEFKEVQNFPSVDDDLHQLPLFKWSIFLFTSLQQAQPATVYLKEMMERLAWLPLDEFVFRPELSKDYHVNAHWALYCENYLEGFHIPFVHSGLNSVIDYGNYTTELFPYASLQVGIAKDGEDCFVLPPSSPDYGRRVAAYYFWVFPNMMFNFYPWGLSVNIVQPLGIAETKVSFLSYVWNDEKRDKGAGAGLDKVEMEDEEIVQHVQLGIRSRFYHHGRYSVTREQGTHHFHRMLASCME